MAPPPCRETGPVKYGSEDFTESDSGSAYVSTPPVKSEDEVVLISGIHDASSQGKIEPVCAREFDTSSDHVAPEPVSIRAYQLEMFQKSLKQNVIVAMDTGSGKTQVAVLRIKAELDNRSADKVIWFLAPTVSLCGQQRDVIQLQATSTAVRLLTGNDNVHNWKAATWNAILRDTRVIVSTPQVLLDALGHAFIRMDGLALIVFDEAHNCVKRAAGVKIMEFYHRNRKYGKPIPSIMGLTASPSMSSDIGSSLESLEAVLDAKCISPTVNIQELMKCVNKPRVSHIWYNKTELHFTPTMGDVHKVHAAFNIFEDPWVLDLQADPTDRNQRKLVEILKNGKTYSATQIKGLCSRSRLIYEELGPWAADRYLWMMISGFLDRVASSNVFFDGWLDNERKHVANLLRPVLPHRPPPAPRNPDEISEKARLLIAEMCQSQESTIGIIFVKERVMVTMLRDLLLSNSELAARFRIGTLTGASSYAQRKRDIFEFQDDADASVLEKFRSGKINLLVATNVLEEGIDVPICNLVVCFDKPTTPKSFIQRRGRARMQESRLVLMEDAANISSRAMWETMEKEMKQRCEDDERELKRLELLEQSEEAGKDIFEVVATGARLDFDSAKQHLEHFCQVLSRGGGGNSSPEYIIENHGDANMPEVSVRVILPSFVPPEQRHAKSRLRWSSQKNATKDAAFQAYVSLYKAGLIGDDLLPFRFDNDLSVEERAAEVEIDQLFSPWKNVALKWRRSTDRWVFPVQCFAGDNNLFGEFSILLPLEIKQPRPIRVFLDTDTELVLRFGPGQPMPERKAAELADHTPTLLSLPFGHRWSLQEKDHVVKFSMKGVDLSMKQIASDPFRVDQIPSNIDQYLIRDRTRAPFTYGGLLDSKPDMDHAKLPFGFDAEAPEDVPYLQLRKWTRRSDCLHRPKANRSTLIPSKKSYRYVLPVPWASIDGVSSKYAQFGMLIPSIVHEIEINLIVLELANTLLQPVHIRNMELVRTAISARKASEPLDYERLEFLGDSILKFCTSIHASAEHPDWPEGYLSLFKDRQVANSRLSRAVLESGLEKFILTKPFTGKRWRPLYVDDFLQPETEDALVQKKRRESTKTLADVLEALIGAAYQDGGLSKAMVCISVFLDDLHWQDVSTSRDTLFSLARSDVALPPDLEPVEELTGYKFRKTSLLVEAMTHAAFAGDSLSSRSLERLEFLGDAVLDHIIVSQLFAQDPPLRHSQMHSLKSAMVNGDFLAFMTMDTGVYLRQSVIRPDQPDQLVKSPVFLPLWRFMRHGSAAVGHEQKATAKRYEELRADIRCSIEQGEYYPWALLARLQAGKFYSDTFEALLGAMWVDSGSVAACEDLVARFGILAYLKRILRDGVQVMHPKELLGIEAKERKVTYRIEIRDRADGEREYSCNVDVGDRTVAKVSRGVSRNEVAIKAAMVAVRALKLEKAQDERES